VTLTLIRWPFDLHIRTWAYWVEIYRMCKYESRISRLSKVIVRQTCLLKCLVYTHTQSTEIIKPVASQVLSETEDRTIHTMQSATSYFSFVSISSPSQFLISNFDTVTHYMRQAYCTIWDKHIHEVCVLAIPHVIHLTFWPYHPNLFTVQVIGNVCCVVLTA